MADSVKVLSVEIDGADLGAPTEFDLHAREIPFSNSGNGFIATKTQAAIEEAATKPKKRFFCQFQIVSKLDYDEYLYSYVEGGKRSGNASNGFNYGDAYPILCPLTGTVIRAVVVIQGAAVSGGTIGTEPAARFQLWKVGYTNQGTNLANIDAAIPKATYTLGTYYNSSVNTNFSGEVTTSIAVSAGDMLGLKFDSRTGNDNIVSVENVIVCLEIEAS